MPILLAADCETSHISGSDDLASPARALLAQLPGIPAQRDSADGWINVNDIGRRFDAANGGCWYIDLEHLEGCLPLCRGAGQFVQYMQAMRASVSEAVKNHNASVGEGDRIEAMFDNRCGRGDGAVSIGTHLDLAVPGPIWEEICSGRYPAVTGFFASATVGLQLVSGLGCAGAANNRPRVDYQIAQRSDFINTLVHVDTMGQPYRALINSRCEPLAGPFNPRMNPTARLHPIALDLPMNDVALFVTGGMLALFVACINARRVGTDLILHHPVRALWQWSHDPDLQTRMPLASGKRLTLPEYFASLTEFVAATAAEEPITDNAEETAEIIDEAQELASAFLEGRWDYAGRRVDWVQKRSLLEELRAQDPELAWDSDMIRMLDQHYTNADPEVGLYYVQRREGELETRVDDAAIEQARHEPPAETRSWGFTHLLRALDASPAYKILSVDWDRVTVWDWNDRAPTTIWLPDPEHMTQRDCGHLFSGAYSTREIVFAMLKAGRARIDAIDRGATGRAKEDDEPPEEPISDAQYEDACTMSP